MSMGIGTNAQHPDEGELTRKLDAVACGVWFTSKGAAIPKMIKYQDEEGFVHSITHIHVQNGSVKNFVALVKNGSFLVRITDMTILIEKEFIYGSSKRPNPTDYYRKQHYQCG